jgi:hypothetical protein
VSPPRSIPRAFHLALLGSALIALYLLLRLPHLRDLPIFCDEATYLRWAQLIHADPRQFAFVSLQDAKFPLHPWLLALCFSPSSDPLFAGRCLSVLAGLLVIPLSFPLARELALLAPPANRPGPRTAPLCLALALICSPLLALFQRLALAESLLLTESLAIAVLSLRLARAIAAGEPRRSQLRTLLLLALAWTAALLTKQIFSYLLWLLPLLALLLQPAFSRRTLARFLLLFAAASAIALALFLPFLLAPSPYSLATRLLYKPTFFTAPAYSHAETLLHNLRWLFYPSSGHHFAWFPNNPAAPLETGALLQYLTPPCLLLLVTGLLLSVRRPSKPVAFLLGWSALLLAPLLANRNFIVTRYALTGLLPLVLLPGWFLAQLLSFVIAAFSRSTMPLSRPNRRITALLATPFLLASIGWPAISTLLQNHDYRAPTTLLADRTEYFDGPGDDLERACAWLQTQSLSHPLTLLTGTRLGIETDIPWLLLHPSDNLQLLACTTPPQTRPLRVLPDPWSQQPPTPFLLPSSRTCYRITARQDPSPDAISFGNASLTLLLPNPPSPIPPTPPTH